MSGPRPQRSSYHQQALAQIRNSLQPFATSESGGSAGSTTSSGFSSGGGPASPNRPQSQPSCKPGGGGGNGQAAAQQAPRGIEYRAAQYPFVPSKIPASVQQLLRRMDSPSYSPSSSSSNSNSPTSQLQPLHKKPTLVIKSTAVPKPVLQTAMPYAPHSHTPPPPPPPYSSSTTTANGSHGGGGGPPPPLPPKPSKRRDTPPLISKPLPPIEPNGFEYHNHPLPRGGAMEDGHGPPNPNNNLNNHLLEATRNLNLNHNHGRLKKEPGRLGTPDYNRNYGEPPPPDPGVRTPVNSNNAKSSGTNTPVIAKDNWTENGNGHGHGPGIGGGGHGLWYHHHQVPAGHNNKSDRDRSKVTPSPCDSESEGRSRNGGGSSSAASPTTTTTTKESSSSAASPGKGVPPPPPPSSGGEREGQIHTHESPIPVRKKLSREKEDERSESKVRVYSPKAFKFFMEQHVENVIKSHEDRIHRRTQLEAEMAKIGLSDEAQAQMRKMLSQKESNYIRLRRAKMDKSLFNPIRTIGVGAFGEVTLVRKLDTQHLYAMKTLRKSDVLRRNQVAHVKAERDILAEADNEWVVRLYYSFQDSDNLYFVMDYIPGGDLMSLLISKGIFDLPLATFYIAELTSAVESVHRMGFIHRDIKPDNILIDRDGHIKLTDFGLCTGFRWTHDSKYYQEPSSPPCRCESFKGQVCGCNEDGVGGGGGHPLPSGRALDRRRKTNVRCLAHSLVGTPNYIAPEVLLRSGYTQLCDWWSVGVILYEMLVGQPPFLAPTPAETQYKVVNWSTHLRIPPQADLPVSASDLILKLCTDQSRRLGKGGAGEIKSHPFLASIDFESGLRRITAPYIPKIRHPTDTSNFDPCDGEKPNDVTDSSNPFSDSNQFHGFFEFTFRRFFDDAYNQDGGPVYV